MVTTKRAGGRAGGDSWGVRGGGAPPGRPPGRFGPDTKVISWCNDLPRIATTWPTSSRPSRDRATRRCQARNRVLPE
eukprot:15450005-Alexandrium_andersonii.AAC.1